MAKKRLSKLPLMMKPPIPSVNVNPNQTLTLKSITSPSRTT